MNKLLEKCPVCAGDFFIKKIECEKCHTQVKGEFSLPVVQPYDEEIMNFIKVFIFTEGSIRQTEKILNCSYPKVKNLLKKTKAALGLDTTVQEEEIDILDLLDKGEIDVDEALEKMKKV